MRASIDSHDLGRRHTGPPTEHVHQRSRHTVRQVIMRARRVIDRISTAASSATFKIVQLTKQTRVVKEFDAATC